MQPHSVGRQGTAGSSDSSQGHPAGPLHKDNDACPGWVTAGCRDMHDQDQEHRVTAGELKPETLSRAWDTSQEKQGQCPTGLLTVSALQLCTQQLGSTTVLCQSSHENKCTNPDETGWMGGRSLQSLVVHWRSTVSASVYTDCLYRFCTSAMTKVAC